MLVCSCPLAQALPNVPDFACMVNFGQIQKVAIQRLYYNGKSNVFSTTAQITKKASWDTFLSANDGTKIVITPYICAPTVTAGEAVTAGGGNDTPNGVEEVISHNPTTFTSNIEGAPSEVIKALQQLECEAKGITPSLGVYLFNGDGGIIAKEGAEEGTYGPIPIVSLFVGDRTIGGFQARDTNALNWSFLPYWSDSVQLLAPDDFNPLSDLLNATE